MEVVPVRSPSASNAVVHTRGSVIFLTILLGALAAMGPLAIDMYLPAFQSIATGLQTDVASVQQTLAVYFVGLALGQLFYGPATDRFGRKAPLYVGLGLFIVASIGCAMSRNVGELTTLRFMQALGGCAEMVVARAIVRDLFEPKQAARVFSSLILVMGLAPILAPLIGGWMAIHVGWRGIFWVLAGFGVACLVTVTFFLRESLPPALRQRAGARQIIGQYAFLMSNRVFVVNAVAGGLVLSGLFAYVGGSPFVFIELYGVPPERFGLFFGANAFGLILSSQVCGWLVSRVDMRRILRTALAVSAVSGSALFIVAITKVGGFPAFLVPLFVFVASLGFVFPTTTALAMAPHGKMAGSASAVLGCVQFFISGIGGLLVSALHNGTALPMTSLIAIGGAASLLCNVLLLPRTCPAEPVTHEDEVIAAEMHG